MITVKTIMAEIRQSRRRMSRECGHDPAKYVRYLKAFNRKYSTQVAEYQAKHRLVQVESR
jgi:parvulin-like peptidyl-prolyl isomerase